MLKSQTTLVAMLMAVVPGLVEAQHSHSLPLGDGRVTTTPAKGNVFACQTEFRMGARHDGPWFHGETWNPLEKPRVLGRIMWPEAFVTISPTGEAQRVQSNGLPVGQPTGSFPITRADPAYQYDTNPNEITAQSLDFEIPADPVRAGSPTCLPMGMIGFTTTGVAFYNALDDAGRDAAAHEIQDLCDGHPQGRGQYHYHSSSACLPGAQENVLVGWALDGYPIMGMRDADRAMLTNAELDDCHGRPETVTVGDKTFDYAYRLTAEYPYVMGCFAGEVRRETQRSIRDAMGPSQREARGEGPRRRAPIAPGAQ